MLLAATRADGVVTLLRHRLCPFIHNPIASLLVETAFCSAMEGGGEKPWRRPIFCKRRAEPYLPPVWDLDSSLGIYAGAVFGYSCFYLYSMVYI